MSNTVPPSTATPSVPVQGIDGLFPYYENDQLSADQKRDWQRKYAAVKRVAGRRKMSKKAGVQKKKVVEREQALPTGVFTLAYANSDPDPERTLFMRMDEYDVWEYCLRLQEEAQKNSEDDNWAPLYVEYVKAHLNHHLADARARIAQPLDVPKAQDIAIHTHRRIIAALHQEAELYSQGLEYVEEMGHKHQFIFNGCRVKKAEFRKIYGF
ncbi:hypothetical protein FA95DRAFT_1612148 [Auriscalpium vulgare]|uniref:Uncharacterized protein n=1 Tax=Auriscalpium vulgare TaxID=40419 RepID=A0ACB8R7I4_9AGAM|nr:hypothetical protein FA95DRAFT_1612148 [Auriscalpium vulgare]